MTGWAGSFKGMAKELARSAQRQGIARVAVLPFEPVDSSSSREGWTIAEKLTTQLVRAGQVKAVERSLLRKILDEQSLSRTGLLESAATKRLGAVFSVDGIITGSFVTLGNRVAVNARLIDVETGLIVHACEATVDREWFDVPLPASAAGESEPGYVYVPAPELAVEPPDAFPVAPPSLFGDEGSELRDAPAEDSCVDASRRVDALEARILEPKARYWARRLRAGLANTSLIANPGSTISDPELKSRFYSRIKYWHDQPSIPELTPMEVRHFVELDQQAFSLHRRCAI
jgi:TolB-like protein